MRNAMSKINYLFSEKKQTNISTMYTRNDSTLTLIFKKKIKLARSYKSSLKKF